MATGRGGLGAAPSDSAGAIAPLASSATCGDGATRARVNTPAKAAAVTACMPRRSRTRSCGSQCQCVSSQCPGKPGSPGAPGPSMRRAARVRGGRVRAPAAGKPAPGPHHMFYAPASEASTAVEPPHGTTRGHGAGHGSYALHSGEHARRLQPGGRGDKRVLRAALLATVVRRAWCGPPQASSTCACHCARACDDVCCLSHGATPGSTAAHTQLHICVQRCRAAYACHSSSALLALYPAAAPPVRVVRAGSARALAQRTARAG